MIPVIDMHCDTAGALLQRRDEGRTFSLRENDLHIDLLRMKKGGYMCQCFGIFTPLGMFGVPFDGRPHEPGASDRYASCTDYARAMSDLIDRELTANSDLIRPALSAADIEKNQAEGFMSALKTIEEGAVFGGSTELLGEFYDRGVRMATLTWNYPNGLAWPNRIFNEAGEYHPEPETERGLTEAGRRIIADMEELGMLIDVSHLGDRGIWDIFEVTRPDTPIIASHSNARGLCGHPRNLSDEMLRAIADRGGVAGINFCADFLSARGDNYSRAEDLINHMKYMKNIAGAEVIGLGTDFDGIGGTLEINGCGEMQKLADAMDAAGFTVDEIEKVFYRNVLRVMKTVLG